MEIENGGLVSRLADRLGVDARSEAAYGKPVEQEGLTVIPVAKVRYGFGGGTGTGEDGSGTGGGGGLRVDPVGYIRIQQGEVDFEPISDPATVSQAIFRGLLGGGLAILLAGWGMATMLKAASKVEEIRARSGAGTEEGGAG